MNLSSTLERFFLESAPLAPGDRIVVGFSGGPDSTALLAGLAQFARHLPFNILALHLDHGLDPGSAGRAAAAARLACRLGVPFVTERREVAALCRPGESLEVAGRRMRYERLASIGRETGARYTATAHHRDDQAETVLLRLLFGSGLTGLAGIRPVTPGAPATPGTPGTPTLVRPLLDVPRSALLAAVAAAGLEPADDPTNRDLSLPRNRLRHRLLPELAAADPGLTERLARLAARAAGAGRRIEAVVDRVLAHRSDADADAAPISIPRRAFAGLPAPLQPFALAALHRRAGAPYPASSAARAELLRQLTRPGRIGCDCGGGWRWEGRREKRRQEDGERLALVPPPGGASRRAAPCGFTYTFQSRQGSPR
ncbi:MAG TPA: tRNA lysidine(34) synthetase TilS [Thermoanaerobaculia bacterium]|jgi:tRNA(Ile)-lysidine synthase|nr:tRNA lysidine(34) synthetase TilS [Thermoanaerobaculia bacterium]